MPSHPIVLGLDTPWPALLGVNEVRVKDVRMCRSLRASRQIKVATPCLWLEAMEVAGTWHGRPISGRIGCQTPSLMAGLQAALDSGTGWLTRS